VKITELAKEFARENQIKLLKRWWNENW
jgi:hypothetical protein